MLSKQLLLLATLPLLIVGCSGTQPPAPLYGNGIVVHNNVTPPLPKPKKIKPVKTDVIVQETPETVKIKPLEEHAPITSTVESVDPDALILESGRQIQDSLLVEPDLGNLVAPVGQEQVIQNEGAPISLPALQKPEVLVPQASTFQPLEKFATLSPAVSALALTANQSSVSGDIDSATTTIERAIRIEPRNATLYYKLALLKLKQSKPRLAEELAKKAALLASNDTLMKKHSWLLVARAREVQGDLKGAKGARDKADTF